ncbi:hypothetical protein [Streptomyces sp. NRRL B-24085]|uniref:hypothetical protein n=1 Tax=Streptomyces sp. NRRL B-24085 TaxID=1709476 RepID=UPI000A8F1495|nr:hypothetical protein [Streptomyces sp. NRRL B-24085]
MLDAVSVTTALSDGETDGEEVVSPWFGIGLSDVDSSAGLSDGVGVHVNVHSRVRMNVQSS